MTKQFLGLCCFLLWICGSTAFGWNSLAIRSAMVRNYTANDFTRISEYFTGRPNNGADTVLRTDETGRGGIYLVIKLNKLIYNLDPNAVLTFKYILSDSNDEKEKVFDLAPVAGRSPWIFIGITGADFHGPDQTLVAWSLDIQENEQLVTEHSYLWTMDERVRTNCRFKQFGNW